MNNIDLALHKYKIEINAGCDIKLEVRLTSDNIDIEEQLKWQDKLSESTNDIINNLNAIMDLSLATKPLVYLNNGLIDSIYDNKTVTSSNFYCDLVLINIGADEETLFHIYKEDMENKAEKERLSAVLDIKMEDVEQIVRQSIRKKMKDMVI